MTLATHLDSGLTAPTYCQVERMDDFMYYASCWICWKWTLQTEASFFNYFGTLRMRVRSVDFASVLKFSPPFIVLNAARDHVAIIADAVAIIHNSSNL